jgi:spore maturation protein CgeB
MPDVEKAFDKMGLIMRGLNPKDTTIDNFKDICSEFRPHWVFSINFSPEIAFLCSRLGIPYVSWTVDPLPPSRTKWLGDVSRLSCIAFAHDLQMVAQLSELGLDARHMLLAAPTARRTPLADERIIAPYFCGASFVGSSMIDEIDSFDRCLNALGGNDLSAQALMWAQGIVERHGRVSSFSGVASLGGVDALPPYLQVHCEAHAARLDILAKLDGVLSAFYRQQGVAAMLRHTGSTTVWGDAGWTDYHPHYRGPADHGEELTQIYCASAVNLDIPRLYQRQTVTMRIFDILACGGFLLAERSCAMEAVFTEGVHLAYYDSHEALPDVIGRWVSDPVGRQNIAAAGRAEVLARHQIEHRVAVILQAVAQKGW